MSDNVFDNFINTVYGGGSIAEYFDADIHVVGGVDDISVDSVFGACDCDKSDDTIDGGNADDEPIGGDDALIDDESVSEDNEVESINSSDVEEEKPVVREELSDVEEEKPVAKEELSDDDLMEEYVPHADLLEEYSDKKKKITVAGGLTAQEVSELLSTY